MRSAGGPPHVHEWWKIRKPFAARNGEQHTLFFQGEGPKARLYMASVPRGLGDVLDDKNVEIEEGKRSDLKLELNAVNSEIASQAEALPRHTEADQDKFQNGMSARVQAIATELGASLLSEKDHDPTLPVSVLTFGSDQGRASFAMGMPLTKNAGNTTGSGASGTLLLPGAALIDRHVPKSTHTRGGKPTSLEPLHKTHLIHEGLHGPYSAANTVRATPSLNVGGVMRGMENQALALQKQGKILRYRVTVNYFDGEPLPADWETRDYSDDDIQKWVAFYIAETIRIELFKKDKEEDPYLYVDDKTAKGSMPTTDAVVQETSREKCLQVLIKRGKANQANPAMVDGEWVNTGLNMRTLGEEAKITYDVVRAALKILNQDTTKVDTGISSISIRREFLSP